MIINLQDPGFQVLIDKDIEANDLEAVALSFMPSATKLDLLFDQRKRLQGKKTFFTHFTYLLEKEISINLFHFSQVRQNGRQWSLAWLVNVVGVKVLRINEFFGKLV